MKGRLRTKCRRDQTIVRPTSISRHPDVSMTHLVKVHEPSSTLSTKGWGRVTTQRHLYANVIIASADFYPRRSQHLENESEATNEH
jgi:hypothetical protein